MDTRQQKTRRAIYAAFTKLLETRSYSSLTVQEIIDAADIGRSTFYAHFETKDDLLKALCKDIFDHVFSDEPGCEKTHDFSQRHQDTRDRITHVLYHLRDNRGYLRGILASESGDVFMRFFKEYLAVLFENVGEKGSADIPRDYVLNHMVCDFAETVRWWMRYDSYSAEEIAGFFMETTPFNEKKDNAAAKVYNY